MAKKRDGFRAVEMYVSAKASREEKQAKRRINHGLRILGSTGEPKGPATQPNLIKLRQAHHSAKRRAEKAKQIETGEAMQDATERARLIEKVS